MNTYLLCYKETVQHNFYIDANSVEEAEEEFNQLANKGKIDFCGGTVVDTDLTIEERKV